MEIQKGMYGMLQAGKIDNDKATITTGLWRHQTNPLQFSMTVDGFGSK